jgi:hypothetical protein
VPADDGGGRDDDQYRLPTGPEPGHPDPEAAISLIEFRLCYRSLKYENLMAQSQVFGGHVKTAENEGTSEDEEGR